MKSSTNKIIRINKAWTTSDVKFLKDNWMEMSNVRIGELLGRSSGAISNKAKILKLSDKHLARRIGENMKRKYASTATADYITYKNMVASANRMKKFRSNFNLNGIHKFIVTNADTRIKENQQSRHINANVISTTPNIVTLQLEHYKESFTMSSFFTGEICIGG